MNAVHEPGVREIWFQKSAQVGWSETLLNVAGYFMAHDPAPILMVQPTLELAEGFSKERLAPMLRDTPALAELVADPRSRDSGNTLQHKRFPGGHLSIVGANSPVGLAMRPVRVLLFDEVDRYPRSAGAEGDPIRLGAKRSQTFFNRVQLAGSTPTVRGISRVEAGFEASDQRRYHVPCPHCGAFQVLVFAQVKWAPGDAKGAWYECEHCAEKIRDHHKPAMLAAGEWRASKPTAGIAGFHLWEGYSPWQTFGELALSFLEAKQSPTTLQTFVNTSLGETWEETGETLEPGSLAERREPYTAPPNRVLLLTAGVDIQDDRAEVEVVGWAEQLESWGIELATVRGDPETADFWERLDAFLTGTWTAEDGAQLGLAAVAIDSGHKTQLVYSFCESRFSRRVIAVKGMSGAGRAILSAPARKRASQRKRKLPVFTVGVDDAKGSLYARLREVNHGPGYCHFPASYPPAYFEQLTAEKRVTRYSRGFPRHEWIKVRPRNEALDVRVYAHAALQFLEPIAWAKLARMKPDSDPPPSAPPSAPAPLARKPRPWVRPRSGWVRGFKK